MTNQPNSIESIEARLDKLQTPSKSKNDRARKIVQSVAAKLLNASSKVKQKAIQIKKEHLHSTTIIASIWNTGCGLCVITIPWAISKAGLAQSIMLMLFFAILMCYTASLIAKNCQRLVGKCAQMEDQTEMPEYTIMVNYYFGPVAEYVVLVIVVILTVSIIIVAYIMLSQYLFAAGVSIYILSSENVGSNNSMAYFDDQTCVEKQLEKQAFSEPNVTARFLNVPHGTKGTGNIGNGSTEASHKWTFSPWWSVNLSVPLYCLLIFGLLNFKRDTIFNRFSALGCVTTLILFIIVIYKASVWSHLEHADLSDSLSKHFIPQFDVSGTIILSGFLQGSFECHTVVVSLLKDSEEPKNNQRDLVIGYMCIFLTYLMIGVPFYITYPGWKTCISDVFVNNIPRNEVLVPILTIIMCLRLITVIPINVLSLRAQLFSTLFRKRYAGCTSMVLYNLFMVAMGCIFAIFYDKIGDITRYVCSFCGMIYVYLIPCVVEMLFQKENKGYIPVWSWIVHIIIILIGIVVFVSQFFVSAY